VLNGSYVIGARAIQNKFPENRRLPQLSWMIASTYFTLLYTIVKHFWCTAGRMFVLLNVLVQGKLRVTALICGVFDLPALSR
jgi:hypothetical protein